jgi:hypothetical protein
MQNYKNHTRWHVLHHFVVAPLLLLHLIYTIVRAAQDFNFDRLEAVILALALIGLSLIARLNALKVQDRLIRLEEQIRYHRILSPDLAMQAENLPLNQKIALRFASDAELPALISRVLGGDLQKPDDIKRAVQNWRADELRV